MTDDTIPDETTTDTETDEQSSWVMIATTCDACRGRGSIHVAGRDLYTRQQTTIEATCAPCGGSGRVLRRERSGGNA